MGNSCSGGFSKSVRKKRRDRAREREAQARAQAQRQLVQAEWEKKTVPCTRIMPVELWECVLLNLKDNTKELLKCRIVCQDFKILADEILQRQPVWTPLFPYISTLPLIFIGGYGETVIRRTRGTRFASARRLRLFLTQMKGCTDNPFPNRTVLLYPNPDLCIPSRRRHNELYKRFPKLVANFGQHIWSLEFCVREDAQESVHCLRSVFYMDNLRSLTVYTRDWNKKSVRQGLIHLNKELHSSTSRKAVHGHENKDEANADEIQSIGRLSSLEHLQIMGSNGILPLNYLFAPYGEQIKSLYFCFMDDASSLNSVGSTGEPRLPLEIDPVAKDSMIYSIPKLTPNVTKLKVYEVNEDLMDRIMPALEPPIDPESEDPALNTSPSPTLKYLEQLSVKLQRPFIRPLNRLCKAIDEHCAKTLVKLHLEISRWPPQDEPANGEGDQDDQANRDQTLIVDSKVKLVELRHLILSYSLFLQEPEFLFKFCEKCPNLLTICFVSVNIHSGNFPDFEGFCKPLWNRLPATLEKISVRYWISHELICGSNWGKYKNGSNYYHFFYFPHRSRRKQNKVRQPEPIPKLQTCTRPNPEKEKAILEKAKEKGRGKKTTIEV